MGPILQTWSGSNVGYNCRNTEGPVVGCTAQDTVVYYQDGNLLLLSRRDSSDLYYLLKEVRVEEEPCIVLFQDRALLNGEEVESCVVRNGYCELEKCKMDAKCMMCINEFTSDCNYDNEKTIEYGVINGNFAIKLSDDVRAVFIEGNHIISLPSVCSFDDAEFYLAERDYDLEYEGRNGLVLEACRHYTDSVVGEIIKYGEPSSQLIIDTTSKGGHAPMKSFD